MRYIIGLDFDNTLVSYDDLMYTAALENGLIDARTARRKKEIRDTIRQLPGGEIKWQQLQAEVYGLKMAQAKLIAGVPQFFEQCRQNQVSTFIVSHKTEFARRDRTNINLRTTALIWMEQNGFFDPVKIGLSPKNVYFESTRQEKIERIRQLNCTHFVDDLEETFLENSFPAQVERILFDPHQEYSPRSGIRMMKSWQEVSNYFFSTTSRT